MKLLILNPYDQICAIYKYLGTVLTNRKFTYDLKYVLNRDREY
jgi:hypothetical protein